MTDNIRPEHYRTGKSDLYEAWYQTYPFEQYRAIMQAIAERYMRRDKNDRVEDLDKAIYTLQRLKEKEIEQVKTLGEAFADMSEAFGSVGANVLDDKREISESVFLLKGFLEHGFKFLARNKNGDLWMHNTRPFKLTSHWAVVSGSNSERIGTDYFPEVEWTDKEPTNISDLLATHENCGENGK